MVDFVLLVLCVLKTLYQTLVEVGAMFCCI